MVLLCTSDAPSIAVLPEPSPVAVLVQDSYPVRGIYNDDLSLTEVGTTGILCTYLEKDALISSYSNF